jgi:hypothetical protein
MIDAAKRLVRKWNNEADWADKKGHVGIPIIIRLMAGQLEIEIEKIEGSTESSVRGGFIGVEKDNKN